MQEAQVIVVNPSGLHARPAARLVQVAARFRSQITLRAHSRTANAKSIVSVLALGAGPGTELWIAAEGADENEAVATLSQVVAAGLGE